MAPRCLGGIDRRDESEHKPVGPLELRLLVRGRLARGDPGLQAAGSKKRGAQQEKEDGGSPRDPLHNTGHIEENLREDKIRSKKGRLTKEQKISTMRDARSAAPASDPPPPLRTVYPRKGDRPPRPGRSKQAKKKCPRPPGQGAKTHRVDLERRRVSQECEPERAGPFRPIDEPPRRGCSERRPCP